MNIKLSLSLFLSLLMLSSCDRSRVIEVQWMIINNSNRTIEITSKVSSESNLEFNSIGSDTKLLLNVEELISEPDDVIEGAEFVFEELIIVNEDGAEITKDVLDINQWSGWEVNESTVRFQLQVRFDDFE